MFEQGEELEKMIGAVAYIECSSKTQQANTTPFLLIKASFYQDFYFLSIYFRFTRQVILSQCITIQKIITYLNKYLF